MAQPTWAERLHSIQSKTPCKTRKVTPAVVDLQPLKLPADYDFFKLRLDLANALGLPDTLWITLIPMLLAGRIHPAEGQTVSNRAEFALRITNYSAELYVTEAYDLFGIWHNSTTAAQVFQSVVSNGGRWNLVRSQQ